MFHASITNMNITCLRMLFLVLYKYDFLSFYAYLLGLIPWISNQIKMREKCLCQLTICTPSTKLNVNEE